MDYLWGTSLKYAYRCEGAESYRKLKKELGLRFKLKATPVASRQKLHLMKGGRGRALEGVTPAMDGFTSADSTTVQTFATEVFLLGCKQKESAARVFNESPKTIQSSCQKVKTENRKTIFGGKVTFEEKVFTVEEERRVSDRERKLDTLTDLVRTSRSNFREDRPQADQRYPH